MIFRGPGFITDNILVLGSRHFCSYLIKGEFYALLGGGVPWVVHKLESQLREHQIDVSRIRYLVISHVHHDHCGAVPYLLRRCPHIEVIASDYGAHLLSKSKPVELMRSVNRETLKSMSLPLHYNGISLDFEPITTSIRAGDGDSIELGNDITLRFYLTPGHSRCSLSTYLPSLGALFPGDALPFPEHGSDKLLVTANHDYDDYIRSFEKMLPLPISLIGYEHGGIIIGEDAKSIIPRGLTATLEHRQRIKERFEELNDLDPLVDEIAEKYLRAELFRAVPPDIMRAMTHRMVRSALGLI
jgi:glyoxylase-like metal-dependent hydrolase (beta-lactamase superfamily II)